MTTKCSIKWPSGGGAIASFCSIALFLALFGTGAEAAVTVDNGTGAGSIIIHPDTGDPATAESENAIAIGAEASVGNGSNSALALGYGAKVGNNSWYSMALGHGASVGGDSSHALAMGSQTSVGANSSRALALGNHVSVGDNSWYSLALGSHVSVGANSWYSLALGWSASVGANTPDSVALGSGSTVHRGHTVLSSVYLGSDAGVQGTVKVTKGSLSVGNLDPNDVPRFHFTRQITGVAAGSEDTDAVNVAQLKAVEAKIAPVPDLSAINATLANHGGRITALESGSGSGGGIDGAWGLQVNGNAVQTVKNGGVVNFTAGNNIVLTGSGTDVTVATVDNPVFSGPVTAGSLVVNGKTYISNQGLNANSQKITNVAAGTEDSDAVNYGQLKAAMGTGGGGGMDFSKINSRIDDVDERISSVGALASAFSALLPMAFDEGNRTSFALGYGHYDGKNAFALGAMHYLSRDALLNVGAAISGSEKTFRVGASFRLGSSKGYETSQVTKGELQARAEVAELKGTVEELTARLERLESQSR